MLWGAQSWPFLRFWSTSRYVYYVERSFLCSTSSALINPRKHNLTGNTVSLSLPSNLFHETKDEELLARFIKGFFGGKILLAERTLLRLGLWRFFPPHFTGMFVGKGKSVLTSPGFVQKPVQEKWYPSGLSSYELPPVSCVLFGIFMLIEKNVEADVVGPRENPSSSYADFAFGSDHYRFTGCHRFQVKRLETMEQDSESMVEFSIQSFVCNPLEENTTRSRIMMRFHSVYASLLFADGMRGVYEAR